ncbi:MAG: bifunctional serine/threonine-protein kinase/formylglycine-generating enzyme family protein [Planctomycetota bacterium]
MNQDPQDRIRQLADAVRIHLQYRAAGAGDPAPWLQAHPELAELLAPMLRDAEDDAPEAAPRPPATTGLPRRFGDYELRTELGRGGMGVVYEAVQQSLGRRVAVKVLSSALALNERSLWRFQREGRLLAQLEHRGIVRVFDAGAVDDMPFYAMELVDGAPLAAVIEAVRRHGLAAASGDTVRAAVAGAMPNGPAGGWQPERDYVRAVVGIAVQVAEALACAHAAGIVHRDVKPANVLVRADGTALLSDFGIARQEHGPALTLTGDFAGTPFYASPEQARGGDVDHRSDVFSLGVTLYELLTLRRPFDGESTADVLNAIASREPEEPARLHPGLPPDLVAVVLKSLEKEPARRYQGAGALAAELRAFLEHRPVLARRVGPFGRAARWARREPLRAALYATVALALLVVAVVTIVAVEEVVQKGQEAQRALADVDRLAIGVRLQFTKDAVAAFRPARAAIIPAMEAWLRDEAEPLIAALPVLREQLRALRARALPYSDADAENDRATHARAGDLPLMRAQLAGLHARLAALPAAGPEHDEYEKRRARTAKLIAEVEAAVGTRRTFRFERYEDRFLHDQLSSLIDALGEFAESPKGAVAFVREQLQWAAQSDRRCRVEAAELWRQTAAAVAADPRYAGLALSPQTDLLPLGRDPASGLQAFVHLRSGASGREAPQVDADGKWSVTEDTGIVFLLVPGGHFLMGAQTKDPDGPNYDRRADTDEAPVQGLDLGPFLLGKYEVTQAQWRRLTDGDSPSMYQPLPSVGLLLKVQAITRCNPVENVSWVRCDQVLRGHGLLLPTEAQWEYACRAGRTTPWSFGDDPRQFARFGNISDATNTGFSGHQAEPGVDDHFVVHAPVGSFAPNAWGFHDMHGNVFEWCRDWFVAYDRALISDDGMRAAYWNDTLIRIMRGGSYNWLSGVARSSDRYAAKPDYVEAEVGVRAARRIEP